MSRKKKIDPKQKKHSYQWAWWSLFVIILITAFIRFHHTGVPLERDEGEYAYTGQLILQGILPYAEAYSMKMPGIYAAYAVLLSVFGETHKGIHIGLLLINSATIFFLFLLGKRLFNPAIGLISSAIFAVLSMIRPVQGIFANAEHFVILPVLCGILLILYAIEKNRMLFFFLSGLLLGLAFTIKQHAAFFILFLILYLFFIQVQYKAFAWHDLFWKFLLFLIGAVVPFSLVCFILYAGGVFDKFWFWTFQYAGKYVSSVSISKGFHYFTMRMSRILASSLPVWIFAGLGLTTLAWNKELKKERFFLGGFFLFSFLAMCPGLYFRPHYFILFFPSVSLLAALGIVSLEQYFKKADIKKLSAVAVYALIISVSFMLYKERQFLFQMSPEMLSRATYPGNPFVESIKIAEYIKKNSTKNDRIAVIGSEPQIYFYANRRSATGYIYTYPLMESHDYALQMQREMIEEIEKNRPLFIVLVKIKNSWLMRKDSKRLIFNWARQYINDYYKKVGVVEIASINKTIYKWDMESYNYSPRSKYAVFVFKRKK